MCHEIELIRGERNLRLTFTTRQLLFICASLLSVIGIVFIYSASAYWSKVHYAGEMPFYMKQLMYFVLALCCFFFVATRNLVNESLWKWLYILSLILLMLVLVPGIGLERNGSRSWIGLGPLTFQPAELCKITTLMYLSFRLAHIRKDSRVIRVSHFVILLLPISLFMMQPDFGSAFILIVAAFLLLFLANYSLLFYGISIAGGAVALAGLIVSAPYRLQRIQAFLDPWQDPLGAGFQAVQSLLAIGPAGLFGHGFLKSRQKYLYLPEPQNDFIFSIVLEEIGFVGGCIILCIFACFLLCSFRLATEMLDVRRFYAIASLTTLLTVQFLLNVGVVVGLLPVTGVTLPFISYGGTSLMTVWTIVGVIYALAKPLKGGQNGKNY